MLPFLGLEPETCYQVKVSARNLYGEGPALDRTVSTPALEAATPGTPTTIFYHFHKLVLRVVLPCYSSYHKALADVLASFFFILKFSSCFGILFFTLMWPHPPPPPLVQFPSKLPCDVLLWTCYFFCCSTICPPPHWCLPAVDNHVTNNSERVEWLSDLCSYFMFTDESNSLTSLFNCSPRSHHFCP